MSCPTFIVNAFADGPFTGNPAGVCVLKQAASEAWMQSVAAQLKVSETAFLVPEQEGELVNEWSIRWFTPAKEVDLCGHATLASACSLCFEKQTQINAECVCLCSMSIRIHASTHAYRTGLGFHTYVCRPNGLGF